MPAVLVLLGALAPLIPTLTTQIMNVVNAIKQNGHLTQEQQLAAHELYLKVHAEVQRIVAARAAEG